MVTKVVKSGQITDPDRLFNDLAVHICDKYMQIGIELGLGIEVLTSELETVILRERRKALRMLQLWRDLSVKTSVPILCLLLLLKSMDLVAVLNNTATILKRYRGNNALKDGNIATTIKAGLT